MASIKEKLLALCANKYLRYGFIALCALFIVWRLITIIFFKPVVTKVTPYVRVITAGKSTSEQIYTYPGEVRGKHESILAFQAAGKIVRRHVNLGDTVKAGQVLLELDPKDIQQTVEKADAALASAEANYTLAAHNAERYNTLRASGAVSQLVCDDFNNTLSAASAALRQAQAQATAAHNQLEYSRLVSDHDGTLSSLTGEIGMVVAAGTPMATVVQAGGEEIQIFVPENRLSTIKLQQKALVTFWALENTKVQGTVSEIASMADSATRTYKVRIAVPALPAEVKLGMTAKVVLAGAQAQELILVPRSAIYQTGSETCVWVINEGKAHKKPVTITNYKDGQVQITEGVTVGDKIITAGIAKLTEGMPVQPEEGMSR